MDSKEVKDRAAKRLLERVVFCPKCNAPQGLSQKYAGLIKSVVRCNNCGYVKMEKKTK